MMGRNELVIKAKHVLSFRETLQLSSYSCLLGINML
jgi:hypothetical protein